MKTLFILLFTLVVNFSLAQRLSNDYFVDYKYHVVTVNDMYGISKNIHKFRAYEGTVIIDSPTFGYWETHIISDIDNKSTCNSKGEESLYINFQVAVDHVQNVKPSRIVNSFWITIENDMVSFSNGIERIYLVNSEEVVNKITKKLVK